jgi:GDP-L-fucose synthase
MNKTIIFGHTGLVGSALVRTAPNTHEIVTISRSDVNLTDTGELVELFKKINPTTVILAAAKVGGVSANNSNHKDFLVENLNIQNAVLMAAASEKVENFVFLGSSCVYPRLATQPIPETAILSGPLEPTNEGYALAKLAGIRLAQAIYEQDNLNYFSVMPCNLYGENDNFDSESSHVPAALIRKFHEAKVSNKKNVTVWGTGTPLREFMHVDDLASGIWHLLRIRNKGQLFNLGTGKDISIAEFSERVAKIVGYEGEIQFDPSKPDGVPRKVLDVSRIESTGWKYSIELDEGLKRTYDWFRDALTRGDVRGF